jgi:hypothetical protein
VLADPPVFYQNLSEIQKQKVRKLVQNTSEKQKKRIKKILGTVKRRRSYRQNDSDRFVRVQGAITISFDSFQDLFNFKNYKPALFVRSEF